MFYEVGFQICCTADITPVGMADAVENNISIGYVSSCSCFVKYAPKNWSDAIICRTALRRSASYGWHPSQSLRLTASLICLQKKSTDGKTGLPSRICDVSFQFLPFGPPSFHYGGTAFDAFRVLRLICAAGLPSRKKNPSGKPDGFSKAGGAEGS